jgi:hypothetical protein
MVEVAAAAQPLIPSHVPREHPVVTREYSLFTPSINDMANGIANWLDDQVDGATIYGPSRFGKSNAVDHWLQHLLSERHGGYVPMVIWSHLDPGGQNSVGRFYAHLLDASKHELAKAAKSPLDRQHMLIERWIWMAHQGGGRFLVLVIDEAQSMTQREWIWLVELHSTLEKNHVRLCVFSIASLQFYDEPMGMALSGGAHVAARFMLESRQFHGVRSAEELQYVLSGYDDATEWPTGSGYSFTAGLAPEAWVEGFRMGNQAESLMYAMTESLGESYLGPIDFPMKTVAQVSRHILLRIAGGANWREVTRKDAWLQVVSQSSHKALMAVVSAGAHKKVRTHR